jgi:methanogenic corrinoid protein MtbC1
MLRPCLMESAKYSLRQIIDMTGITEFTLRGWELRYEAFVPIRTPTGRRQYSNQDLQKALLLRELVKRSHRIGEIAGLRMTDLQKLMISESEIIVHKEKTYRDEVHTVMKHVALQDWDLIEKDLLKAIRLKKPITAIGELIVPLIEQMGREVGEGRLSIAQEHILSAILKQQLHMLAQAGPKNSKIKMLMATPEGDFHELGILSAHAMACQLKIHSLFLGPNTPKKDLCETALRFGATHIVLASTLSKKEGAKEDFHSFVHFLDQNLPAGIQFWLAGRAAGAINLRRNSTQLSSLHEFEDRLKTLLQGQRKNA